MPPALHAVADMERELGGCSCNALAMRNVIEGLLHLGMIVHEPAQLIERTSRLLDAALEFEASFCLRFAESHLHAAMRIDFAFARRFDREEDHVAILVDDGGLRPIGLSARHTAERLQRED